MGIGFKADLLVEKSVIVEIKSVELVTPVFKKKTSGYLKLAKITRLINNNID
jgi:GxxExxY protein